MVTKIQFASKKFAFLKGFFLYDFWTHNIRTNQRILNLQNDKQTNNEKSDKRILFDCTSRARAAFWKKVSEILMSLCTSGTLLGTFLQTCRHV